MRINTLPPFRLNFGTSVRIISEEHPERAIMKTTKHEGMVAAYEKSDVEPGDLYVNRYTHPPTPWVVEHSHRVELPGAEFYGLWLAQVRRWVK